jgi:radical SAM protein with 4Fe4S-binding SPASM domain
VEPVLLGEQACYDKSKVREFMPSSVDTPQQMEEEYHRVSQWYIDRVRSRKIPRYHHYSSFLRRLINKSASFSECGAGVGYFSVGPDGTIYACHRENLTKVGHLYQGGIDHELAAPWQDNRLYARKKCPTCAIRYLCGGGCREASLISGLPIDQPLEDECALRWIIFHECAFILSELSCNSDDMNYLRTVLGAGGCSCATR